ncbi:MAG: glycosyltransferase involved in cell wall biosynthesis [Parasphingorhabdus sp.]|jgi:glycosyltransferase involved in cell wall biosynthesis
MKILFVVGSAFLPEEFNGQNRTITELCVALTSMGHVPAVLSQWRSPYKKRAIYRDQTLGFCVYRTTNLVSALSGISLTLRPNIVVVIDHATQAIFQTLLELKLPLVNWLFQKDVPDYLKNMASIRTMATTRDIAETARVLLGEKIHVVPPYIDFDYYRSQISGTKVLFVNPIRSKGVEWFIDIARKRPEYRFIVLQSVVLAPDWRRYLFEQFRACGNIELLSPTQDVRPILKDVAILLVPRLHVEGFARIVTEAQSSGIPVMGFDTKGVANNIGPGGSIFALSDTVQIWLNELDRYLTDASFLNSKSEQAFKHSQREEIDPQKVLSQFLKVLTGHIKHQRNNLFYGAR